MPEIQSIAPGRLLAGKPHNRNPRGRVADVGMDRLGQVWIRVHIVEGPNAGEALRFGAVEFSSWWVLT